MRVRPLLLALLVTGLSSAALAAETTTIVVSPGDELGRILQCLGHRKLWGPDGVVAATVEANPPLRDHEGNLIFPNAELRVPVPPGVASEDLADRRGSCRDGSSLTVQQAGEREAEDEQSVATTDPYEGKVWRTKKRQVAEAPPTETAAAAPPEPTQCPVCPTSSAPAPAASDDAARLWYTRVGLVTFDQNVEVTGAIGNPRARYGGVNVAQGKYFPVTDRLWAFAQIDVLALTLWADGDLLQPLQLRGGAQVALLHRPDHELWLVPSLRYDTLLRSVQNTRYRDLWGLGVGLQYRGDVAPLPLVAEASYFLSSSDQSVLSAGNRRLRGCIGVASHVSLPRERWSAAFCGESMSFSGFTNGSGFQTRWDLGVTLRY